MLRVETLVNQSESESVRELFPAESLPALLWIPASYLELKGDPMDPLVQDGENQDKLLRAARMVLAIPDVRERFIHHLHTKNYLDDRSPWASRAAELLIPFVTPEFIASSVSKDFDIDVARSAMVMGRVVQEVAKLPELVVLKAEKINGFSAWVHSIDPLSFTVEYENIVTVMRRMLKGVNDDDIPERKQFAQAVLERSASLSDSVAIQKSSYYDRYLQCIARALEYGANTQDLERPEVFFERLKNMHKGPEYAKEMAQILSGWAMDERAKVVEANSQMQAMFALREDRFYEGNYDDDFVEALDMLSHTKGFSFDQKTLQAIAAWAGVSYAQRNHEIYDRVVAHLAPHIQGVSMRVYAHARSWMETVALKDQKLHLDMIMAAANPAWLFAPDEPPFWLTLLVEHEGDPELLRLIHRQAKDETTFLTLLIEAGHKDWINEAKLDSPAYERLLAKEEIIHFERIVEKAQSSMIGANGDKLPNKVLLLLRYTTNNSQVKEAVSSVKNKFLENVLKRHELSDGIKDELDTFVHGSLSMEVVKSALEHRAGANLYKSAAVYMLDAVKRSALDDIYYGYEHGFLGDGLIASAGELFYILRIPQTERQGDHLPKIAEVIERTFRLIDVTQGMAPDQIKKKYNDSMVLYAIRLLAKDPYWHDELLKKSTLRAKMPLSFAKKLIAASLI